MVTSNAPSPPISNEEIPAKPGANGWHNINTVKQRLFKLVLFLFLGAVFSVAVAWLTSHSSLHPDLYWNRLSPQMDMEKIWSIYALPNWPGLQSGTKAWEVEYDDTWEKIISANEWNRFGLSRLTCYVKEDELKIPFHSGYDWIICEIQAGWPARCLNGGIRCSNPPLVIECVDALLLPESKTSNAKANPHYSSLPTGRIFVYRPIWWGLIINIMFYAVLLYAIATGWRYSRRYVRHKRGHCIKCGYDLLSDSRRGCPECGWGREEVKV